MSSINHKISFHNIAFHVVQKLRSCKTLSFSLFVMLALWGHPERPEACGVSAFLGTAHTACWLAAEG